jgi:ferric-dicitrate binding protein FerR (iron transport regulator)
MWAESGQLGELIQPDTKLALKKVHHAIRQKPIKVMPYISATYLRAVAAVFIIGLISFVTWQLVNKTAKPAELQVVESVNLKKEIHLSDGTIVWLNKTSKLTFPQQFNDSIRKVELEGEAFLKLQKILHNHLLCRRVTPKPGFWVQNSM